MQEPGKHIPSYADTLSYEEYVLRPDDRLYIYVYSVDENVTNLYNSGMGGNRGYMRQQMNSTAYGGYDLYTYLVDENGNIQFPTLGDIQVQGKTTREVKHLLEDELSKLITSMPGYATVSVDVSLVQRSYSIIGMQSGRYNIIKEKMTILEALAQAGDIADWADRSQIKLVREIDGQTVIKEFDVRSKDIINSEFYYIEPNDIIYIRRFNGYSFGVNHVSGVIGVTASFLSYGVFVYSLVQTGINHVQKHNASSGEGGAE